jgi:8-oxo-dGTP diphosphatase
MMDTKGKTTVLAAIIENDKGKFLLACRKLHLSNGGKWEFPGGKLNSTEDPETCLKREINEELGVNIRVDNFFYQSKHSCPQKSIFLIAYRCVYLSGKIKYVDHDRIEWVDARKITGYDLSEADIPIAKKLQSVYQNEKIDYDKQ